jgi:hypothetical protein
MGTTPKLIMKNQSCSTLREWREDDKTPSDCFFLDDIIHGIYNSILQRIERSDQINWFTVNESKQKFWIGPNGFAYAVAKEEMVAKEFIRAINRVIQNIERISSVKNLRNDQPSTAFLNCLKAL